MARRSAANAGRAARAEPRGRRPGDDPSAGTGPHPVELAGLLHEMTALLVRPTELGAALDTLASFTRTAVAGSVRCTAGLVGDGVPMTVGSAGAGLGDLDRLQYDHGAGPSVEATRTRTLVTVADLATDPRWPDLAARAPGPIAVAAVPLDVRRHSVGALTIYLDRPGTPDAGVLITLMALAGQAEVLLAEVLRRAAAERLTAEQISAMRAEAVVDHAVGVIVAQRGCDPTEAYGVLYDTARRLGLPPAEVATRLVDTAVRRTPRG